MSSISNKSMAVFLTNENVRGVVAVYNDDDTERDGKFYKTFDPDVKVGDLVVVPAGTRLGFTTNKVVAVDVEPDFERTGRVDWIAGRVDPAHYEDCLAQEEGMIEQIRAMEKAKKREEMAESLKEFMGDSMPAIEQVVPPAE